VQPIVAAERPVFHREVASGMYSQLPFAVAQVRGFCPFLYSFGHGSASAAVGAGCNKAHVDCICSLQSLSMRLAVSTGGANGMATVIGHCY
jgi:hypothetical protein